MCGNAQVMGVFLVFRMNWLVICIDVEQLMGKDAALCLAANYTEVYCINLQRPFVCLCACAWVCLYPPPFDTTVRPRPHLESILCELIWESFAPTTN